jgi:hypothetical protein
VTVKNLETGLTRSATTGEDGSYTIPGLPPGRYQARGSLEGFATAIQSDIALAVAQQASLNLTLKVGARELRTVVGAPAPVDVKTSALSTLVDERTIEQLPLNGRNFMDLALLQPGVAAFSARGRAGPSGRGQQININGADGRANSYLLFRDHLRPFRDEDLEQRVGLRREMNLLAIPQELSGVEVERAGPEANLHDGPAIRRELNASPVRGAPRSVRPVWRRTTA